MAQQENEIEAKVRVDDARALLRAIEASGAEYAGAWIERDAYFDHPDQRLRENDSALRLRERRPLDEAARALLASGGQGGEAAVLTYKGPLQSGRLKVRQEHEVSVPEPKAMERLLGGLQYRRMLCYEKRRRKWRLEGVEITLDEIPEVGTFAEVEGPSEADVDRVLARLGLADEACITKSYLRMVTEALGDDIEGADVRFEGPELG